LQRHVTCNNNILTTVTQRLSIRVEYLEHLWATSSSSSGALDDDQRSPSSSCDMAQVSFNHHLSTSLREQRTTESDLQRHVLIGIEYLLHFGIRAILPSVGVSQHRFQPTFGRPSTHFGARPAPTSFLSESRAPTSSARPDGGRPNKFGFGRALLPDELLIFHRPPRRRLGRSDSDAAGRAAVTWTARPHCLHLAFFGNQM